MSYKVPVVHCSYSYRNTSTNCLHDWHACLQAGEIKDQLSRSGFFLSRPFAWGDDVSLPQVSLCIMLVS